MNPNPPTDHLPKWKKGQPSPNPKGRPPKFITTLKKARILLRRHQQGYSNHSITTRGESLSNRFWRRIHNIRANHSKSTH